ncbi:hypothetical protein Hanom_Chr03g00240061 [Helianthus anomalus]
MVMNGLERMNWWCILAPSTSSQLKIMCNSHFLVNHGVITRPHSKET